MKDDYLWDRSGPPDPQIERMERALEPFRFHRRSERLNRPAPRARHWLWAAAAAAVVLCAAWLSRGSLAPAAPTAWQVAGVEGTARLGSNGAQVAMAVRSGQVVRTGNRSQVTLEADPVGRVDLGPDSELRASTSSNLLLRRGQLHAFIWARPRDFVVDTPSASAVDLGCEYTLNVNDTGDGRLRVSLGWVAFQYGQHEAFIPAGAECVTRRRSGPGIPFYEDASDRFRRSLEIYEDGSAAALPAILAEARSRDGLTLWHLLTRVAPSDRGQVFDRFARLVTLPAEVTRDAAVRGDPHTIDLCWDALNLEDTGWWRGWERNWK
ncbi:MAG TPA: FecR domain-containing protein [Bryobacteraceae bacterium]|nr:FecR domain-containing protein [Bryobacteraceae bacterium]